MGCYLNPKSGSKEDFLDAHGRPVSEADAQITRDELPVCLVDNGFFTAAGIAFSQAELKAFKSPDDLRVRLWYMVKRSALRTASDLQSYEDMSKFT